MGLIPVHVCLSPKQSSKAPVSQEPSSSRRLFSQTRNFFQAGQTYFTPSWKRPAAERKGTQAPPNIKTSPTNWRERISGWENGIGTRLGQWRNGVSGYISQKSGWMQLKQEVLDDLSRSPYPFESRQSLLQTIQTRLLESPEGIQALCADPEFQQLSRKLFNDEREALQHTLTSPAFQKAPPQEQIGLLLGHLGGGPGKILQMLSSDPSLPEEVRETFSVLKSRNLSSRKPAEAQTLVDRIYGANRYQLGAVAGVGTIGEVYYATDLQAKRPVVIKLINKNASRERMETLEKPLLTRIIRHLEPNPSKQTHLTHQLDSLYREWVQEFNLEQEAKNAEDLGKRLRRCHVAQPLERGRLPESPEVVSLVMEQAKGVRLDRLSRLLHVYQRSPALYQKLILPLVGENPWLRKPERWMRLLPAKYRDVNNEQAFLQIGNGPEVLSHGDLQTANASAWFDESKNKMELVLFDTGMVVRRTPQEAAQHLGLMLNTLVGNSRGMAENLVDMAASRPDTPKAQLVDDIAAKLDRKLYKAHVNLMDFQYNNQLLNQVMQESQIVLPDKATVFFKSQADAYLSYEALSRRAGQAGHYLSGSLGDIFRAAASLIRYEPHTAARYVLPALSHLRTGGRDALRNTLQFFLHRPPL